MTVLIRTRYDYDGRKFAPEVDFTVKKDDNGKILNPEVLSMTKQEFREEADINSIIKKALKTGFLVDPAAAGQRKLIFGDFASAPDFLQLKTRIARVENEFSLMPADIRNRFANDASQLIDFLADSKNDEEAIRLGLKPRPPKVAPPADLPAGSAPAPVVPPPATPVAPPTN